MFPTSKLITSFLKRSALVGFAAAGLFCVYTSVSAQSRAGGDKPSRFMDRIDAEEGAKRLAAFRQQRLEGDFCFAFELAHKPRRGRTVRYDGMMWGSWNEKGPVTRFRVSPSDSSDASAEPVELIVQNGAEPRAWIRRSKDEKFEPIKGEALFEPILPGLLYSPFDLQMPFVYWDEFIYEGPVLVGASRIAQQFLMQPPADSASAARGVAGVRIGLDDTYDALWRIEVIGEDDKATSRFAVESFKKVSGQYIVKRITLTDYVSKDRTTFEVKAAEVGMSLDRKVFDSCHALSVDTYVPSRMKKL